jgi:hypothetical protein
METFTSTGTATGLWVNPLSGGGTSIGTTYFINTYTYPNNTVSFSAPVSFNAPINFTQATSKQIMQNKVAVFKVKRQRRENH